jgi:hypothetical membrane protein
MAAVLTVLQITGIVLGTWTVVSVATAIVLVPWFRAQARANAALSARGRRDDWAAVAHPASARPSEIR